MFAISDRELADLRMKDRKILKTRTFHRGYNPARNWSKYRHPLVQGKNYAIILVCKLLPPCELKNHLYRLIGVTIGKNVSIANDAILDPIFPELIKIEDNVIIGWGTKLFTHEFTLESARIGSIIVKKNSMIGEFSVVRPGVTVGQNSLVAAMSFVNEDVPPDTVEGGVPIHILRHLRRKK